jgi:MFS family permease
MTAQAATASLEAARLHYPRRWLAAIAMIVAALMDMIDVTIVNVALPTIRNDLGASGTQLEWVVSAYMLAFAAALITAGSFGDLLGRKRIFLLGVALFGGASLAAGLAQTPGQLIAARVVQGAAGAAMLPQVLATFRAIFSGKERGQAFGLYGAILGFASAIGLVLGGVLTEADLFGWSWRSVFFVNVPVALFSFVAAMRLVPETRERSARRPDLVGASLLAAALVAIVYPLLEGRQLGWPHWLWLPFAAGLVTLAVLGLVEERRGAHHVGIGSNPWPIVPGLVVAGAGLALLVIPLANVVLAAVPSEAAGGASGLFTTVQQVGGAIGVAVIGTVFFDYLSGHSFLAAFTHSAPLVICAFLISAALSLVLPRTAVADEYAS